MYWLWWFVFVCICLSLVVGCWFMLCLFVLSWFWCLFRLFDACMFILLYCVWFCGCIVCLFYLYNSVVILRHWLVCLIVYYGGFLLVVWSDCCFGLIVCLNLFDFVSCFVCVCWYAGVSFFVAFGVVWGVCWGFTLTAVCGGIFLITLLLVFVVLYVVFICLFIWFTSICCFGVWLFAICLRFDFGVRYNSVDDFYSFLLLSLIECVCSELELFVIYSACTCVLLVCWISLVVLVIVLCFLIVDFCICGWWLKTFVWMIWWLPYIGGFVLLVVFLVIAWVAWRFSNCYWWWLVCGFWGLGTCWLLDYFGLCLTACV